MNYCKLKAIGFCTRANFGLEHGAYTVDFNLGVCNRANTLTNITTPKRSRSSMLGHIVDFIASVSAALGLRWPDSVASWLKIITLNASAPAKYDAHTPGIEW